MIAGNVPKHLVVSARTGFLSAIRRREYDWQRVAMTLNMSASSQELVDLGAAPMPLQSDQAGGGTIQSYIEKNLSVKPESWDITVFISQNTLDDDQTASLDRKVRSAGDNFQKHINKRVFTILNAGDGQTYSAAYDGQDFFDSDHVDKGADYQTSQDNENILALTPDNFETVWVSGQSFRDDRGEFVGYNHNLLVVHPTNKRTAANIAENAEQMDTANREMNPFSGEITYITTPEIDTNAWFLIAADEPVKPIILAMRKQPVLQSAWFDPMQPDGGYYFFKFFARYEAYYGDWRLAIQGQT